jgi:hypothetical protein
MRKTYLTALLIAVVIITWIASGLLGEDSIPAPQTIAAKNAQQRAQAEDRPLTTVRVPKQVFVFHLTTMKKL